MSSSSSSSSGRRFKEARLSSLNADIKLFARVRRKRRKMKQIASECKEMLTMPTMRSVSPKPTFHRKEKEEKDTADVTSKKADGAFASSMHIAREEEVRNNISRRDFEISQPLLYVTCLSQSLSFARRTRKHERENTFCLYFAYAHFSLSLMCD